MFEDIIGILFLLVGAIMVAVVWLFFDVRDIKTRMYDRESEGRFFDDAFRDFRRRMDQFEEKVAKLDYMMRERKKGRAGGGK